jgi:hypothetical protein
MKPDLAQFEQEFRGKLSLVKVDVNDTESDLYKKYIELDDSDYVPHIILIDTSNKVLAKHTGQMSRQQLADFVKPHSK